MVVDILGGVVPPLEPDAAFGSYGPGLGGIERSCDIWFSYAVEKRFS
jgi:hypothetical protein